ncbi:MAG: hypothetical protein Phog2KO_29580 [Phototrophicaceae bacterium]
MGQYNRLGQRRASGAWQWLIIGFFPGLLCGGLVVFLLLFAGILNGFSSEPEQIEITSAPIRIVVTATNDPLATQVVQVITTTPEPTEEAQEGEILVPTLEPIATQVEVNSATQDETDEPTTLATLTPQGSTTEQDPVTPLQPQTVDSTIPIELASSASNLVRVEGGIFQYGTDAIEVTTAAGECQNRDGGQCLPDDGLDSTPRITVQLDTFWIEQSEVTFDQYVNFLNYQNTLGLGHRNGCQNFLCIQTQNERPTAAVIAFDGANYRIPANYSTLVNHPAYGVTWYGAQSYCQALGRRLPTEAEWEYAARAGGQDIVYPWGNNWNPSNANVRQPLVTGEDTIDATVPVTEFFTGANALGLTHMAGNVAEWVQDYYGETYYLDTLAQEQQSTGQAVVNPTGPAGGTTRVLRGGSFNAYPFFARTVHRQAQFPAPETPEDTFPLWVGFRCASDTGADTTVPATTGDTTSQSSALPTIPATGADSNTGAQPTAEVPSDAQSESDNGDASRG